mgnify:CR=1 FL=1
MEIQNRKAKFEYFIEETIEAGIALKGTEIKSLRKSSCDLSDSFAIIKKGEVYLLNAFIAKYDEGNIFNHDTRRTRKLLLHKNEITKIFNKVSRSGYSLIPLDIHFKNGKAKVTLGICRGKKLYDKRQDIAKKDQKREAERDFKMKLR